MGYEIKIRESVNKHLDYKDHQVPKRCCGNCCHSKITNPGASIPGLMCRLIMVMNLQSGVHSGDSQVHQEAICAFYTHQDKK